MRRIRAATASARAAIPAVAGSGAELTTAVKVPSVTVVNESEPSEVASLLKDMLTPESGPIDDLRSYVANAELEISP